MAIGLIIKALFTLLLIDSFIRLWIQNRKRSQLDKILLKRSIVNQVKGLFQINSDLIVRDKRWGVEVYFFEDIIYLVLYSLPSHFVLGVVIKLHSLWFSTFCLEGTRDGFMEILRFFVITLWPEILCSICTIEMVSLFRVCQPHIFFAFTSLQLPHHLSP